MVRHVLFRQSHVQTRRWIPCYVVITSSSIFSSLTDLNAMHCLYYIESICLCRDFVHFYSFHIVFQTFFPFKSTSDESKLYRLFSGYSNIHTTTVTKKRAHVIIHEVRSIDVKLLITSDDSLGMSIRVCRLFQFACAWMVKMCWKWLMKRGILII